MTGYTAPPKRKRRVGRTIGIIVLVLVLLIVGMLVYVDSSLKRTDALPDYSGRPPAGAGANWLLVGSDSRDGLTDAQKEQLATGDAAGARTDTIMLLHIPSSGKPTLVSLLRDSYVSIPGNGRNKLNAAFAFGGAPLLEQTVEGATGLHIDHYMEIGFGGFANVVDAIGGVTMCIDKPMVDPKAGLNLQAGCQDLDGAQALGYVRTRATPAADLDRVVHQRQFLSAVVSKVTSPSVLLNPFRFVPLLSDAPAALTINNGDHLWHLASLAFAMSSKDLVTTTVPMSGTRSTNVGSVVIWDTDKAARLFDALKTDAAVPPDVLSGS
ncbi:MAG: LCP family protein [Kutzneria sp.]|nr:LCP family protein [Kutzneria sp.]MBV9847050.1 LCP family protein [Kutzneria sp.]